jgi:hypothetical protein
MRIVIISFILIILVNNCDGLRNHNMKNYIKTINKAIYNICNKKTFNETNNKEIYYCLNVNNTNDCKYLKNFSDYQIIRLACINKYNSEIGSGIFITIIIWLLLTLCFMK